ncbi:biopolymer transport protein ExbD [Paraburkholderia fungorum]|uniref:Biopolymer transport protein ExbD n=1 Tax=Paraburkholderia fungorum TaxID=134537 RepID=A0A1H1JC39_9BURK|nr:biopolymer transporter ExbD [Paraburkholderia fungorum]SDR47552.1 biopolymer transport protein ExbD [Paraburkholderia fungorum]
MAIAPFSDDDDTGLMSEINMTPLVDVMLVLLIIFLVTIPALQHAVRIDLPRAGSQPEGVRAAHVDLAVDVHGAVLWDGQRVTDDGLRARIAEAARATPQPELHLRADRTVPYERVAEVMSAVQAGGLTKMAFVTMPKPRH